MKYDNRNRCHHYIFTVQNKMDGEILFEHLKNVNRSLKGGFRLQRFGRLRNRKSNGISRRYGHVSLNNADRWDIYLRRSNPNHSYTAPVKPLLRIAAAAIKRYKSSIEYVNVLHKQVFEKIINEAHSIDHYGPSTPELEQVITKPENLITVPKPMKTTDWKVALTGTISVAGDTVSALENTIQKIPELKDVVLKSYEQLDSHRDLPLVRFDYCHTKQLGTEPIYRSVRVTKLSRDYIEGFEGEQFKKFRVDRVRGSIALLELPTKS